MTIPDRDEKPVSQPTLAESKHADPELSAIAYSLDTLIPGLYLWLGRIKIRLGGSASEETYPGTIHSPVGMALVLPGYRIYSTYQGRYDP